jgi:hypothetical protein
MRSKGFLSTVQRFAQLTGIAALVKASRFHDRRSDGKMKLGAVGAGEPVLRRRSKESASALCRVWRIE